LRIDDIIELRRRGVILIIFSSIGEPAATVPIANVPAPQMIEQMRARAKAYDNRNLETFDNRGSDVLVQPKYNLTFFGDVEHYPDRRRLK